MKKTLDQVNLETEPEPILTPIAKGFLKRGLGVTITATVFAGFLNLIAYGTVKEGLELEEITVKKVRENVTNNLKDINYEELQLSEKIGYHFAKVIRPGIELACRNYEKNLPHNID